MRTKSYFNVYLKNFLLILCVPIITIIILYIQAENSVNKQIISANNNTLNQFFRLIDAEIEEMKNLVIEIGGDEKFVTYAQYAVDAPNKTGYQGVLLNKALIEYGDEKYEDIFVFYPYENRVVSGVKSLLNKERYWETYYNSCDYNEFVSVLECPSFQPVLCSIDTKNGDSYFCVAMRKRNNRNPQRDFVVVAIMRPSYLEKMMIVDEREVNGQLVIFDKNKELLISSNFDGQDDFEILDQNNVHYETYIGNTKYMVHVKSAESIEGGYAFIMPYAYFWKELFSLRTICGIGGLLCIVVSIYLAYKRTKVIYYPIESMITSVEKQSSDAYYNNKEKNEFEFFESIVQNKTKKIELLEKKLVADEDIRKQHWARTLLEGEITAETLEGGNFEQEISLSADKFFVATVNIHRKSGVEEKIQRIVVSDMLDELSVVPIYIAQIDKDRYAVIFCLIQDKKKEDVVNVLINWHKSCNYEEEIVISVGMGEVYVGIQGIRESYKESMAALRYKWLLGEGRLIEYTQVANREFDYKSGTESKIFRMVMEHIKDGNGESADKLVYKIFDVYNIHTNVSINSVECFKYEVFSVLNNVVIHINAPEEYRHKLHYLMECFTIMTYKEHLNRLFNDLHIWYNENVNKEDACSKVKSYVEQNYSNSYLSVADISKEVNLTSSYLSKQFKEKYNISILDYIAQTRIKNAKILLQDASLSVKQVAEMTGFLSDNVFIKTFKKWEGITPKNYRNLPFGL